MPIYKHLTWFINIVFILLLASNAQANDVVKIKFGIVTLGTPSQKYAQWHAFADYLKVKTGFDIEIVAPKGFQAFEKTIDRGAVDIFFTNSFIFYQLKQKGKALGLAQMQNIDGSTMSHSKIFVRSDSGINKIEDLKGKSFSFVSPVGAGGYLAPRAMFQKYGINTKKDLTENFTRNVASSIHSVILDDAQAGTMCGINYRLMSKKLDTAELKIIATSDDYPEGLIGANPDLSESIREKLKYSILGMRQDKKGKEILQTMQKTYGMKIGQFIKYDAKVEKITQALVKQAGI